MVNNYSLTASLHVNVMEPTRADASLTLSPKLKCKKQLLFLNSRARGGGEQTSVPYCVCFGPDASSPQWVCLVVCRLPLFFCLKTVLPHSLVHRHVVGQQVVTDVELQSVADAARVQELCCLGDQHNSQELGYRVFVSSEQNVP